MTAPFHFGSWIKTGEGAASLSLVILCGSLLGFLTWRTFLEPPAPHYPLEFGEARWIRPPSPSPTGYFRKDLFIDSPGGPAWVMIASADSYELYLNGKAIASKTFVSTAVTGLYDLTGRMNPGKNVIAVRAGRATFPGPARIRLRGAVRELSGRWREFSSDETWKASPVPVEVPGGISWNGADLDDTPWSRARTSGSDDAPLPVLPVDFDPRLLRINPQAEWIGGTDSREPELYFQKEIRLERRSDETWIGIAATGAFEFSVNGTRAVSRSEASGSLELFRITPRLHQGANTLLLRVKSDGTAAGLLADGMIFHPDGAETPIRSDESWRAAGPGREGDERAWKAAARLASYGSHRWGPFHRSVGALDLPPGLEYRAVTGCIVATAGFSLLSFFLWRTSSALLVRRTASPPETVFIRDALLHLPVVAAALILLVLNYDIRLHPDWIYQPAVWAGLMGGFAAIRMPARIIGIARKDAREGPPVRREDDLNPYGRAALLALIMLFGLYLRASNLPAVSLNHDEVSMIKMAKGVLTDGYPHAVVGSVDKELTTYELVPYPIALSAAVFGWTERAVRLPAVIFGTAAILLIGLIGSRLFDRGTGLLAAAIYAVLPWSVQWARNAFYPQQLQLFALITFWLFYKAVETKPFHRGYLAGAAAAFVATYLSWEGTGFILPAFGLIFLIRQRGDRRWLKDRFLWSCLGVVGMVVILQQIYRILSGAPYLAVGSGLSEVGLPTPFFLDPMYDPFFYIPNFLWLENHVLLTILACAGIPLARRHPGIRYLTLLLGGLLFLYTNFLSASAGRYAYFLQPLLILLAAGSGTLLYDRVRALTDRPGFSFERRAARLCAWTLAGLLILGSEGGRLKLYRLGSAPDIPIQMTRSGVFGVDYRSAGRYVQAHWREGDAVIPAIPHAFEYYTGLPSDYFLNTLLAQRVIYDAGREVPVFTDRFSGSPVILNLEALRDVLNRSGRVWIIAAPYSAFVSSNDPSVIAAIAERARVVFETYEAKVYLWEGVGAPHGAAGVTLEK